MAGRKAVLNRDNGRQKHNPADSVAVLQCTVQDTSSALYSGSDDNGGIVGVEDYGSGDVYNCIDACCSLVKRSVLCKSTCE